MLVAILPSCQCHAVHGVFNGLFAFDDNLNFFALPLLMTYNWVREKITGEFPGRNLKLSSLSRLKQTSRHLYRWSDACANIYANYMCSMGGSVAEWLACWTQA